MSTLRKRSTLGRNNNQKSSSQRTAGSQLRELLADDETVVTADSNQTHNGCVKNLGFGNFVVRASRYEYPRMAKVPATRYYSKIADMKVREKNGKLILDVYYDLEDVYGQNFHIIQSYPEGSQPFQILATALAEAGVPNGATVDAGIGLQEIIEIDYISKNSDLGSIVERKPYVPLSDDDQEDDDEYDDLLDD